MKNKEYLIEQLPSGFSKLAIAVYDSLPGDLYWIDDKLVFTDESAEIETPRGVFAGFGKFEEWLLKCATEWIDAHVSGMDSTMFDSLEDKLKRR